MSDWETLSDDPIWTFLRDRVVAYLSQLGSRYLRREGDWYLLDEDTGQQTIKVELVNNDLLRPATVKSLQALLRGYPGWAIALQIDGVDADGKRHGMGVWIEEDHVSDELRREYLSDIFQDMRF